MAEIYTITNNTASAIALNQIPEVDYPTFYEDLKSRMKDSHYHVANYFAYEEENTLKFILILLNDKTSEVMLTSHKMEYYDETSLPSLTALFPQFHPFERDIKERYGVKFDGMPWDKPLRFAWDRFDRKSTIDNYPFYKMEGRSLHEVNVGPIHAGIIEPGAFRFICSGEKVLHLEIALGFQHRGVEHEMETTDNLLRQVCLSECIAGDSSVAHSTAFIEAIEKLSGKERPAQLDRERGIALELERIAMQIGDTAGLSTDVGYQLGQVASEALRTMTINTTQAWCGNRFGKGLIRPHGTNHPLNHEKAEMIRKNVKEIMRRYQEVADDLKSSPTVLARFEQCGIVPRDLMAKIGGVGQAARASGLKRDIRASHPWGIYAKHISHQSILHSRGDIMARLKQRIEEIEQSAQYILHLLDIYEEKYGKGENPCTAPNYEVKKAPQSLSFGLIEGWRGEICHVLITDAEGRIKAARLKDASLHNWMALALAVRGEGISDFPICNKSFNLSYCGHDL